MISYNFHAEFQVSVHFLLVHVIMFTLYLIAVYEWAWDNSVQTSASRVILDGREVYFHPGYSSGTAAVRGDKPCVTGSEYYWEIKVLTPLYGTDVVSSTDVCQR